MATTEQIASFVIDLWLKEGMGKLRDCAASVSRMLDIPLETVDAALASVRPLVRFKNFVRTA